MSANTFGSAFRVTTFGESHGVALGCVIDGCPAGLTLSTEDIQRELDRRRPGQSAVTTQRAETDRVEILSGVFDGQTLGTPIALVVRNSDQRSGDYDALKDVFRPGHADYTWAAKFGVRDHRGGGRSSGRETLARVAAGAVAQRLLDTKKIRVIGYAEEIAGIRGEHIDLEYIEKNSVRAADAIAAKEMEEAIIAAARDGDSVGGVIRLLIQNVPAGLGEPVFDKTNALLGHALLSIAAVKGIEFGDGFALAGLRGSASNDAIVAGSRNEFGMTIAKASNRHGGIAGGITDGSDISIRVAIKPTATIAKAQQTVDTHGKKTTLAATGRHDPCIVPRAVPVVEAMARLALADLLLLVRTNRV